MSKKEAEKTDSKIPFLTHGTILFVVYGFMFSVFLYFLSSNLSSQFGMEESFTALAAAAMLTLFLLWTKRTMHKNLYLGVAIAIAGFILFVYGFLLKFSGPNTMIFLILFTVIYFCYVIYVFVKRKKTYKGRYEYEDKL